MDDIRVGSKRNSDYSMEMNYGQDQDSAVRDTKKGRSDDMMMRLLLAGNDCGAIVGKGGENLTRLRKEFNVDVNVPGDRNFARVFMVTGQLNSCLRVVNDILVKHVSKGLFPVGPDNLLEINLLVVNDLVGHILSNSGIEEIQELSDTKIKIYQECLPNSNERVVAIGSDLAENIVKCVWILFDDILQNVRRVSQPHYYNPTDPFTKSLGIPGIDGDPSHEYGCNSVSVGGIEKMGTDNSGNKFLESKTETKITVSNKMCCAIMGKVIMGKIRDRSGAQITYAGELDKRVIIIAGTQHQVQHAEQLLTE